MMIQKVAQEMSFTDRLVVGAVPRNLEEKKIKTKRRLAGKYLGAAAGGLGAHVVRGAMGGEGVSAFPTAVGAMTGAVIGGGIGDYYANKGIFKRRYNHQEPMVDQKDANAPAPIEIESQILPRLLGAE